MANSEQMQQAMSQMMNSPMMQSVLNDPEMLRNMFSSNPAIQQVCVSSQGVTMMLLTLLNNKDNYLS